MLSEISVSQIRDNYWFANYGPFNVIMDKSNGYINATKLCRAGGKEFKDWSRLKGSHELINALQHQMALEYTPFNFGNSQHGSDHTCSELSPPCILVNLNNITDTDGLISGTYCHPDLVPHIACWVSPVFALSASKIINHFLVEDWKMRLQASEESAAQLLLDLQLSQQSLEEVSITTKLALEAAEDQRNRLEAVVEEQHGAIQVKKEAMGAMEEKVCEKIRERQVWSTTHAFTILKLHDENGRHSHYSIRCQGRRMSGAISKLRNKFPAAEVIYTQRKVPNAINLYSRLKDQKIVEHTRNYCTPTCSEQQLLYHLNNLCGTAYPASNPLPLNVRLDSPESP